MATTNVLFVCGDNSATSILAESILRANGAGRFRAFSAGWQPAAAVSSEAIAFLRQRQLPAEGLLPKSFEWFVDPNGPRLDFAILLSDAVPSPAPEWNGAPVVAHWSIDGEESLRETFWVLTRRIKIFASLPHGRASRVALQNRVHSIAVWQ
ncbi:MAG: low molecular weight phosphatase family protein [Clostridia bacterium]